MTQMYKKKQLASLQQFVRQKQAQLRQAISAVKMVSVDQAF